MSKIYVDYDENVPRYVSTDCYNCTSLFGTSFCEVKNRGCCWYYPKFNLVDIHRMVQSIEGLQILELIKNQPGTIVYKHYIHAKGYMDIEGFNDYLSKGDLIGEGIIEDHSMFFRACPFVKPGYGCSLPPRYRTTICNFFICNEIVEKAKVYEDFKPYLDERSNYVRWTEWENTALQHILIENNINLVDNFNAVVHLLQSTPMNNYDFPELKPINIIDDNIIGA